MLKIKDDVDLKELEKFGFKFDGYRYIKEVFNGFYSIFEDRYIGYRNLSSMACDLTTLYDLIKADLVEKVGD